MLIQRTKLHNFINLKKKKKGIKKNCCPSPSPRNVNDRFLTDFDGTRTGSNLL